MFGGESDDGRTPRDVPGGGVGLTDHAASGFG
jgi:hypothetical protein